MSWNNKMFITVEQKEKERQKHKQSKNKRDLDKQIEERAEGKSYSPLESKNSRHHFTRPKTNASNIKKNQSKLVVSPSLSGVTSNEEYFKEMQSAILSENKNLKQHNEFLKKQIEVMFERQKRYKNNILQHKQKIVKLETINSFLQQQFDDLISNTISQINRIQGIIQEQKRLNNILSYSNPVISKHSEQGASQTQSTIHKDLQDLKVQVQQIYYNKKTIQQKQLSYKNDSVKRYNRYFSKHGLKAQIPIPQIQEKHSPDSQSPNIIIHKDQDQYRKSSRNRVAQ